MLTWLLNGEREHGIQTNVLGKLVEVLSSQGHSELEDALENTGKWRGEIKIEARWTQIQHYFGTARTDS